MKEELLIYKTKARHITVIRGNSGNIYPFYQSSGDNSHCEGTWFPWLGHFTAHPQIPTQLIMAKPNEMNFSTESIELIQTFIQDPNKALNFKYRICADEQLAISCSIGQGVWELLPDFRKAVSQSSAIKPHLKSFYIKTLRIISGPNNKELIEFKGEKHQGIVFKSHADIASQIEAIIKEEKQKYLPFEENSPNHNKSMCFFNSNKAAEDFFSTTKFAENEEPPIGRVSR